MLSKWYWFIDTLKLVIKNLFVKDPVGRHWLISEDRLENYQRLERNYNLIQAEKDMWYNVAQTNQQKLEYMTQWVNANWRVQNEKQSI